MKHWKKKDDQADFVSGKLKEKNFEKSDKKSNMTHDTSETLRNMYKNNALLNSPGKRMWSTGYSSKGRSVLYPKENRKRKFKKDREKIR